jgi:hypothetical protein
MEQSQPKSSRSVLGWLRISLQEMFVLIGAGALVIWSAADEGLPITVGLTAAFLVAWFWRQWSDAQTPQGAVCGLPAWIIALAATQSLAVFWAEQTFKSGWVHFGKPPPESYTFEVQFLALWFPVILTALPANRYQSPHAWRTYVFELVGAACGLLMALLLAKEIMAYPALVDISVRGYLAEQVYRRGPHTIYDWHDPEPAIEALWQPAVQMFACVIAGLVMLAAARAPGMRGRLLGWGLSVVSVLIALFSIRWTWQAIFTLLPTSSELIFSSTFEIHRVMLVSLLIVVVALLCLTYRHSLGLVEVVGTERWFRWARSRNEWAALLGRQWPAWLGIVVILWPSFGWYLEMIMSNSEGFGLAIAWAISRPLQAFFCQPIQLAAFIALIAHAWRLRPGVSVQPKLDQQPVSWATPSFDLLLLTTHLVALALALYFFTYTAQLIRTSPIDWVTPRVGGKS